MGVAPYQFQAATFIALSAASLNRLVGRIGTNVNRPPGSWSKAGEDDDK
jgi:hypothetical protein